MTRVLQGIPLLLGNAPLATGEVEMHFLQVSIVN